MEDLKKLMEDELKKAYSQMHTGMTYTSTNIDNQETITLEKMQEVIDMCKPQFAVKINPYMQNDKIFRLDLECMLLKPFVNPFYCKELLVMTDETYGEIIRKCPEFGLMRVYR